MSGRTSARARAHANSIPRNRREPFNWTAAAAVRFTQTGTYVTIICTPRDALPEVNRADSRTKRARCAATVGVYTVAVVAVVVTSRLAHPVTPQPPPPVAVSTSSSSSGVHIIMYCVARGRPRRCTAAERFPETPHRFPSFVQRDNVIYYYYYLYVYTAYDTITCRLGYDTTVLYILHRRARRTFVSDRERTAFRGSAPTVDFVEYKF